MSAEMTSPGISVRRDQQPKERRFPNRRGGGEVLAAAGALRRAREGGGEWWWAVEWRARRAKEPQLKRGPANHSNEELPYSCLSRDSRALSHSIKGPFCASCAFS